MIHRLHHEVQSCSDADQTCHGIHRVVVDERRRVQGSGRHYGHQLGDGQRLGLDQRLSLTHVGAEDLLKAGRIHLAQ